jgi:hypothetical protein
MVVDFPSSINRLPEIPIALVTVDFEFQCFHQVYYTLDKRINGILFCTLFLLLLPLLATFI